MIGFIGDPHCSEAFTRFGGVKRAGINERGELSLVSYERGLQCASAAGCEEVVVCGDLIDSMRPAPQVLARLRKAHREARIKVKIIKGNHDSGSDTPGDNALEVLSEDDGSVEVIDVPKVLGLGDVDLFAVPFRAGKVDSWLDAALEKLDGQSRRALRDTSKGYTPPHRLLCLHAGIRDNETAPWLRDAPDAIDAAVLRELMKKHSIEAAFAGNWHDPKVFDGNIHQVGALCPTGFSNLGKNYGRIAIYSQSSEVRYKRVGGPRFLKLGPRETPASLERDTNTYFVEWTVPPAEFEAAKRVAATMLASKVVAGIDILPDTAAAVAAGAAAAREGAKAEGQTVAEAATAFVSKLVLPEGVEHGRVAARVRKFLGV
jgi:DNA repair exonuclease SbcCD nuclease subunit